MKRPGSVLVIALLLGASACTSSTPAARSIDREAGYVRIAVTPNDFGLAKECALHGCIRDGRWMQAQTKPVAVYSRDLQRVVGHWYQGKGFVPLGTNPDDIPAQPSPTTSTTLGGT